MHKELAKITSTYLGVEDHGIFTSFLHVRYEGSSGQGIGGYTLTDKLHATGYGAEFIKRTIEVVGVESWEKIPGNLIYVLKENDGWGAKILGIESLDFSNEKKQLIFADLFKEFFGEPDEVSGPI